MTPKQAIEGMAIQPGTELAKEVRERKFILPSSLQVLQEEKYLLENLSNFKSFYWGDHGKNIVPQKGWLPKKMYSEHLPGSERG